MNSSWGRALGKTLMKTRKKFKPEFKSTRWNIVTGDEVRVMNGPQTGQQGNVLAVIRKQNRVIVDGVNMRKRAVKTNDGSPGKMITKPVAMSYANIMLIDPSNGCVLTVLIRSPKEGNLCDDVILRCIFHEHACIDRLIVITIIIVVCFIYT